MHVARASAALIRINWRFDQLRPAWLIMIESGGPLGLVLPHLELLEGFLHLLAARALRAALGGGAGDRVRPRDAGQPVFRLLIARQDGLNEDPGDAAGRD